MEMKIKIQRIDLESVKHFGQFLNSLIPHASSLKRHQE
jgi:hypothetical protein